MPATVRVVIVGAGLAGGAAAQELRAQGFDGDVTVVGAELHPPYERPPLSKSYLRGESDRQGAYLLPEESWAALAVNVKRGVPVARIDRGGTSLELADGSRLRYDKLILATGSRARPLPGAQLDGVRTLRTFEDADEIRLRARRAEHVLVVGGGWIGSEVTASLRQAGVRVTWALAGRLPLERALGQPVAQVYDDLHAEHEVTFLRDTRVVAFDGDGDGRVRRARTAVGDWIPADLVVVAVGATPQVELAESAGLRVLDGVVADGLLQSDDPRILVAGDVARVPYPDLGRSLRVEHWGAAQAQGRHAARTVVGRQDPYGELPYFYSDQYDTGMEFWGDPLLTGEIVVRGELRSRSFTALWHRAGRVRAVLNMHVHHHGHGGHAQPEAHHDGHAHDDSAQRIPAPVVHAGGHLDPAAVMGLLRSPVAVDVEALRDPSVPLEDL